MARKRKIPKAGVAVHTGDTVVIPAGQIRVSLKRDSASGTFTRDGIAWFMQMLYFQGVAEAPAGLDALLQGYMDKASSILERSALLDGIDLNSEAGASDAINRLMGRDNTIEAWAMRVIGAGAQVRAALADNDTLTAVWAMNQLANSRAMLLFKQELEDLVWRGYLAEEEADGNKPQT